MQQLKAGIDRVKREYIGEWGFLHRGVDETALLPTFYPKQQSRAVQGIEVVFHNFHRPYYYCCNIYIYIYYILFGTNMHKAMSPVK